MQFDKDIEGEFSDIFLKLREIKEVKNAKQTS